MSWWYAPLLLSWTFRTIGTVKVPSYASSFASQQVHRPFCRVVTPSFLNSPFWYTVLSVGAPVSAVLSLSPWGRPHPMFRRGWVCTASYPFGDCLEGSLTVRQVQEVDVVLMGFQSHQFWSVGAESIWFSLHRLTVAHVVPPGGQGLSWLLKVSA
jgi:hypothetical protein